MSADAWGIDWNPGTLIRLRSGEAAFSVSPDPYGFSELTVSSLALAVPFGPGGAAFACRKYGADAYRKITLSGALAWNVDGVGVGIGLSCCRVSISAYGDAAALGLHAGLWAPLLPDLLAGISLRNLNSPASGTQAQLLPQRFSAGLAWIAVPELVLTLEADKLAGFDPAICAGCEFTPVRALSIRLGVDEGVSVVSAGVGIAAGRVRCDYALLFHPDLGWSQEFSAAVEL
jgi:hypothetical protein